MTDERTRRIQERAYSIWEQEGRPPGRDAQHWGQAEREIDVEDAARAFSSAGTTTARRQPKPRAITKTIADASSASLVGATDTTVEASTKEPVKTRGRKPKAVSEDSARAPKAARGRKGKAVPEEGAGSSTAAGDPELKATAMAQEAVDPNWETPQAAGATEEPAAAPEDSHTPE